jgi:hypothetical protein
MRNEELVHSFPIILSEKETGRPSVVATRTEVRMINVGSPVYDWGTWGRRRGEQRTRRLGEYSLSARSCLRHLRDPAGRKTRSVVPRSL